MYLFDWIFLCIFRDLTAATEATVGIVSIEPVADKRQVNFSASSYLNYQTNKITVMKSVSMKTGIEQWLLLRGT